jgi:subtilisin
LHNVTVASATRGSGIRIGIIDEALKLQGPHSCIAHVHNDTGWPGCSILRATTPKCDHGQAVSSLIASRPLTGRGFEGIAPGAEVYFCGAGADQSHRLLKGRLVSCIDYLAQHRQCDIVSISAGDSATPIPEIEAAVGAAADHGAICFFAAGNDRIARFPACYNECFAVAALGQAGNAPRGTVIESEDLNARNKLLDGSTYLWNRSARGAGVDFCAPGIGVIWNMDGISAEVSFGTSFACPIAVGVAVSLLSRDATYGKMSRDRARWQYALKVFQGACRSFGSASESSYWEYGRMSL